LYVEWHNRGPGENQYCAILIANYNGEGGRGAIKEVLNAKNSIG